MSYTKKSWLYLLMFLLALAGATSALAQGIDGTLRGEVKDPTGAMIPGAKVTVRNEGTGLERSMETTSAGTYNFPNLLVGTYTITVEMSGFKKYVNKGIEIKANQITDVSPTLEVGAVENVVEVTAGAEMVQTTTAQLGSSWDSRAVTEVPMPVLSGDPQNLAILAPGTTTQSGGVVGVGGSIGGNRPRNNNFTVDGIDNNDVTITGPVQPVIPDAIAEFTLLTNQFSAEYGHSTAGQFIQATKSGTNNLHGNAFWFVNNRNFNALTNLDAAAIRAGDLAGKPRFDSNRVGGTLGGPIIKDKWFLFGAYQYFTQGLASTPGSATEVPTAAGLATLNTLATTPGSGVSQLMVGILANNLAAAPVASRTVDVIDESTGEPVPVEVGVLTPAAPNFFAQHDWNLNMDVNTARHRFSGRFMFDRFRSPNVPIFPLPRFLGTTVFDARSVTFADVFTITPTVVNEFRAGFRRSNGIFTVPDLTPPGGLDVFPNFEVDELGLNLGPEDNSPQFGFINTYQVSDTLSWARGRHTLKGGVDFRWWIAPSSFLPRARAEYFWSDLNGFVKDIVPDVLALRGVGTSVFAGNQKAIYGFFQDDLKVHPRLTLNLGIRYEYSTNPRDANTQTLNAIADLPNPSNPALPPLIFRKPKTDTNNWAPRFGFAWDVFGNGKTAVRGGFAVAYDVIFQNLTLLQLPPQLQQELNPGQVCGFTSPPAWCPTGPGFVANGGLPNVFNPGTQSQAEARSGTQSLIVDTVAPVTYTWSLGVQREFMKDWSVEARYVGTRGLRLPVQIRRNISTPPASFFLPTFFSNADVPATLPATPNLDAFLGTAFGPLTMPYLNDGFDGGFITAFDPVGNSIYHGGSIEVTRRMTSLGRWANGFLVRSGYTFSRAIDDSTNELNTSFVNPRRPEDTQNLRAERGLSALHHQHKFTLAFIYETPKYGGENSFLKGFFNRWQLSTAFIAESGQPVTPLSRADANGNLDSAGDRAILNPNFTAPVTVTDVNFVCRNPATGATSIGASASACGGSINVVGYVAQNPAAQFVRALSGARTNTGRNILTTAGINNWNLSIFKKTHITEQKYVEFRAEMINALNHPQFILGSGNINIFTDNAFNTRLSRVDNNPNFLKPETLLSGGARTIQFGLKFFF